MEGLNLAGIDRAYVCTAVSSNRVFLTHCALRLKKSGTIIPRMELVEVGPSMDLVMRRHRLPNDGLRKEAMKTSIDKPKKKVQLNKICNSINLSLLKLSYKCLHKGPFFLGRRRM